MTLNWRSTGQLWQADVVTKATGVVNLKAFKLAAQNGCVWHLSKPTKILATGLESDLEAAKQKVKEEFLRFLREGRDEMDWLLADEWPEEPQRQQRVLVAEDVA